MSRSTSGFCHGLREAMSTPSMPICCTRCRYEVPKLVPIGQQIPRGPAPRKGVHHLLRGPCSSGMLGDVDMDETAPFMGQDEQDEEHCVGHGWHDKEIQGHEIPHVIREKGLPRRRGWL